MFSLEIATDQLCFETLGFGDDETRSTNTQRSFLIMSAIPAHVAEPLPRESNQVVLQIRLFGPDIDVTKRMAFDTSRR